MVPLPTNQPTNAVFYSTGLSGDSRAMLEMGEDTDEETSQKLQSNSIEQIAFPGALHIEYAFICFRNYTKRVSDIDLELGNELRAQT